MAKRSLLSERPTDFGKIIRSSYTYITHGQRNNIAPPSAITPTIYHPHAKNHVGQTIWKFSHDQVPMPLPLHIKWSHKQHLADSRAMYYELPLLQVPSHRITLEQAAVELLTSVSILSLPSAFQFSTTPSLWLSTISKAAVSTAPHSVSIFTRTPLSEKNFMTIVLSRLENRLILV